MRQIGALLVGGMGLVGSAEAGAPLATEDAGVLEARACEWETYAQRVHANAIDPVRAVSTQVGCGIGWRSQVGLGYARAASGGVHDDAIGLAGKTGLLLRNASDTAPFST